MTLQRPKQVHVNTKGRNTLSPTKIFQQLPLLLPAIMLNLGELYATAQTNDRLLLNDGTVLIGQLLPFSCSHPLQLSFQPNRNLPQQSLPLVEIATIQVAHFVLEGSNTTADPNGTQIAALKGLLSTKARPSVAIPVTLSLGFVADAICSVPEPPSNGKPSFTGRLKIDGNATFGAQVQRTIGGSLIAELDPSSHGVGSVTPVLLLNTSYGDTIKGPKTTKSSQVDMGTLDLQIRLHNPGPHSTYGSTNLNIIADEYHSFSQGIALQQGYGAGLSQNLGGSLRVEGDIWYLHERRFKPTPSFSSAAARFRETDTIFSGNRFVLTQDLEVVMPFKTLKALLVRGGAELTVKLGNPKAPLPFSLNIAYADYYFRNAPSGYKQNYAKLTLGVAYTW